MFPKFPESFQNSRKVSKIPGKIQKFPVSFQNSRKVSKIPGKIQNSRKDSKIPGKFPKFPESFQNSRKDSKIPGKLPKFPESFQNSRKVSKIYWKFSNFLQPYTEANLNLIWDSYPILQNRILSLGIIRFDDPLSGLLPSNHHWSCWRGKQCYFTLKITVCKKN